MKNFHIRYKNPITAILLLLLLGGVFTYRSMKTSLFPNITFPKVKIIAENGEQPVDKMMVTVTKPLEIAVKKVENIRLIRSTTGKGSCEISAFMKWGSDIDKDKQQIESRISEVKNDLPPGVQITVEKMNPSILPVIGYSLQSKTKSPIELKLIANYTIKPYLSRIDGVASVDVIGGKDKEYRVELNEAKMKQLNLSAQQIADQLIKTGFIESTGITIDYDRLYMTTLDASIKNIEQLKNTVVFSNNSQILQLKDLANIKVANKNEYVKIKADGNDVPLIAILKQPDANLIDVTNRIENSVSELASLLPNDVHLKPYYNQSEFVNSSIKSIIDVLWIGLLLAIIVTIIFLRSMRASLVILITIPMTLALTIVALYALGFDYNIMTIGGIAAAIGLIIDDAIIVVEQIHRTHEEFPERSSKQLVGKAIHFLFPAMVSSALSTIVILLPFELMSGVAGSYFKVLTETMIITLVASFLVTWIGLPVIYLLFSRDKEDNKKVKPIVVPEYKWIKNTITKPIVGLLLILGMVASIVFIISKMPTGFLPEMDEGSIVLDFNSPPGTSLEETDRMLNEVDKILATIPEVKTYSRRIGTQMGFFITEPNRGDYLIELKKQRNKTTEEVSDLIRTKVESTLPALTVDFGEVITDMLGDLMTSAQPIEIKVFGNSHEELKKLSTQIADSVSTVPGTADVFDGITIAGPAYTITPNEAMLLKYGLSADDLRMQVQTYVDGNIVGSIPEKEQLTPIRMLYPDINKMQIEQIKNLQIADSNGNYYPLSQFATFEIKTGVAEIERENLQSMGAITARLSNRDLGSVMKEIRGKLSSIPLPSGYNLEFGGSYASQQKSFQELLRILIFGSLLVFIVVLFMFRDIKISFVVILISILGISGSILALWLFKIPLNVGSYTGMIMIIGILGENSIFTIQQFKHALKTSTLDDALVHAIAARLRPKLMTVVGAVIALTPLALGIGTGAQMHQPLAIAVIGGLIMALPLLLVLLPIILRVIYRGR